MSQSKSSFKLFAWKWFLPGCLGAAWQLVAPIKEGFQGGWEMLAVARSLATTGVFANPNQILETGPTAMQPPGYPVFASLLLRMFGDGLGFTWAMSLACIFAHGLYCALLPAVSERMIGQRKPGYVAALMAAILPAFPFIPQWDAIFTTTLFLLYVALTKENPGRRALFGLGAFAGFLSLWNPMTTVMTGLLVLFRTPLITEGVELFRSGWQQVRSQLRGPQLRSMVAASLVAVACWAAGYAMIALPWQARNYAVLGTWAPRTNLGATLYAANNDCASPGLAASIDSGCYDSHHPNKDLGEARLVIQLGEAGYEEKRVGDTLAWMRSHPRQFAQLTAVRIWQYWFPDPFEQTPFAQAAWFTTILGFVGLGWMLRDRLPGAGYLIAVSVIAPLPYYIVVADIRYRAPILWVAQIAGSYALVKVVELVQQQREAAKLAQGVQS